MESFAIEFRRLSGAPAIGVDGLVRSLVGVAGTLSVDEARVLSGVAFRTYFLTPDDNHAYREVVSPREWAWGSLDVENYGVLESLWAHLDRDLRHYVLWKPADLLALAKHELREGRPLIARLRGWTPEHVVVTALVSPGGRIEVSAPAETGDPQRLGFGDVSEWDPEAAVQVSGAVTVRPSVDASSSERRALLRQDVLLFAGRHARSRKELNHAEELFYASGLRAWEIAAELLTDRWRESDVAEFERFWAAWTAACRDGRRAAAAVLGAWSEQRPELTPVAAAFAEVADAVPVVTGRLSWNDPAVRGPIARALCEARDRDEAALEALAHALNPGA